MRTKLCAYDNGYGIVISEYIGDSVHAMDRIPGDKFKIVLPHKDLPSEVWDREWKKQRDLVNEIIEAYNEKYNLK